MRSASWVLCIAGWVLGPVMGEQLPTAQARKGASGTAPQKAAPRRRQTAALGSETPSNTARTLPGKGLRPGPCAEGCVCQGALQLPHLHVEVLQRGACELGEAQPAVTGHAAAGDVAAHHVVRAQRRHLRAYAKKGGGLSGVC